MRTFDTGATRDTDDGKPDLEGFLSPVVLDAYADYMNKNRVQADGGLRASDNWQKGIPQDAYIKSAFRHFMDLWRLHRGQPSDEQIKEAVANDLIEEACCAMMFNVMGYLFEHKKKRAGVPQQYDMDGIIGGTD